MADYYLGEIRMFTCAYAPQTWHLCDGSLLNVQQNAALYSLIGTKFGGDGKTTFGLPDLRGRVMAGVLPSNPSFQQLGTTGGAETVAIDVTQMPPHTHDFNITNTPGTVGLNTEILANPVGKDTAGNVVHVNVYNTNVTTSTTLNAASIGSVGSGQGHNNMQPFTTVNFCIAIQGLYPQRN